MWIRVKHPADQLRTLQLGHLSDPERVESGRIGLLFDHVRRPAELVLENANGGTPCIFIYFVAVTEMLRQHKQCFRDKRLQGNVARFALTRPTGTTAEPPRSVTSSS